ncbi:hypothetical protein LCGC14_1282780 [marine sediment metagenome]|uniref:Uncharacterized protein n=1 Tax=marine sediment metagenome TaxID=412755 RepID=A0A0F9KUQ5_9ZZZZ
MPVTQLQPIRQPSVGRAMQNALAIRGAETRNLLAEKQLGTFDETQEYVRAQRGREEEKQEWARSLFEFQKSQEPVKRMEAFDKILRMTLNYSTYATHDEKMKNLQTITKGDFSTVPTAEQIQEKALKAGKMPEQYYEEVWKPDTLKTWAQKSSEKIAEVRAGTKETSAGKEARIKRQDAAKAGLKKPTTAMAAFLKNSPDATNDEIAAFAQKLKTSEKVPPKVSQAQKLVLKFAQTMDPMMAALISMNPAMANSPLVKQAMDAGIPPELKPAYDEAIKIIDEYYGVETGAQETAPESSAGITHEFVPGKGLVPVQPN